MHTPSSEMVEHLAARFRALGDPTRIRILAHLQRGESTVSALATALEVGQASVSKHLALLRSVGFVRIRRQGTQAFCSILDPVVPQLCQLMCDGITRFIVEQHHALVPRGAARIRRHPTL